ncbi:eukaryotic translation initiation factor 3 subunit J-A-like [Lineus longissimus]|uniref:eukaryotic translation initiation factor 3 subunit J-A-like n=1 Tax=Lineus longissimus TaxID=88925 RepID=UPI002B4F439D
MSDADMADWDADEFEPSVVKASAPSDKWAGEDEEEELKDNWDDDDDDAEKKKGGDEATTTLVTKKKKKPIGERIREKEEKKRKELEEKRKKEEEEKSKMGPAEIQAEKMKKLRLQEESDLELAKDAFGVSNDDGLAKRTIDSFHPTDTNDFESLASMLKEKLTQYESSVNYPGFLETLFRDLVAGLSSEDIKKLGSTLNAVANEKQKQQKNTKGKRKKKGPSVKEGGQLYNYDDDDLGDEFDGFL